MELKLIVDQRERNQDLIEALESTGISIDTKMLPVGDYIISDRICVERKTASDFESSIINGRLFDQIERLVESYDMPILIIEVNEEFRLSRKVIAGTIVALYVDYGLQVLYSDGPENTAEMLVNIAKREQDSERRAPSLKGGRRAHTNSQFQEFVIGNLPGIGTKLAKSLLKHFGNVKRVANASVEELMEVEKIGKKKAEALHETLNSRYEAKNDE